MSEQNNTQQINESEPSRFTALKDQFFGATKEVIGAVFSENLQNAGAEQRIHGEKALQTVQEPSLTRTEASEPSGTWFSAWSAPAEPTPSDTTHSEPAKSWFPWAATSSEPSTTVSESSDPSKVSALKDQVVGATKEVFGAVFNEDIQNAGAEQRIQGEKDLQALHYGNPTSQPSWSAPWSASSEPTQPRSIPSETWSDSSDPSKIVAVKDQILGATKEVLGAVFNENLHSAGLEQRIHGEREYEIAVMNQEKQANWDQAVGTVKENAGQALDNKKMQSEGWAQRNEAEVKRVLNA